MLKEDEFIVHYPIESYTHPFDLNDDGGYLVYLSNRTNHMISMISHDTSPLSNGQGNDGLLKNFDMGYTSLIMAEKVGVLSSNGEKYGTFQNVTNHFVCLIKENTIVDLKQRSQINDSFIQIPTDWQSLDFSIRERIELSNVDELLEIAQYNAVKQNVDEVRILAVRKVDSWDWH